MTDAFNSLIKETIAPMMKAADFRKTKLRFHRRSGSAIHMLDIQRASYSEPGGQDFYVNVGIVFDEVCDLADQPIIEKPAPSNCDSRGHRWRLEKLLPDCPDKWRYEGAVSDDELLAVSFQTVADTFKPIQSAKHILTHQWADKMGLSLLAQVHYLGGDDNAARTCIDSLCAQFEGRRLLSQPSHWIEDLGLARLNP